jgi:hypothetical protein
VSRVITVYVPCDVAPVRVMTGYDRLLTPVEKTVLHLIGHLYQQETRQPRELGSDADVARAGGVDELVQMLWLGRRPTLDLLADLWRCGYLVLDFARSRAVPTATVLQHLEEGTLGQLASGESSVEIWEVMIDKLSGHVVPARGPRRPRDPELAVPAETSDVVIDDASPADLLDAVHRVIEDERRRQGVPDDLTGRHRRPLTATLVSSAARGPVGRRWLPVDIRVGIHEVTDGLLVSVVDPGLPLQRQQEAAARILQIVEALPGSRFAQRLRKEADTLYREPAPLEQSLAELQQAAAASILATAGTRRQAHRDLMQRAWSIRMQIEARVASEVEVNVLLDAGRHRTVLKDMVESATRQVVLVSPLVNWAGVGPLVEPLKNALRRGVQVVLLWGRDRNDTIGDESARQALNEFEHLGGGPGGQFLWSPGLTARTRASMAVADDRQALVTGLGILGDTALSQPQLGVHLGASGPGRCLTIESLLEWARRAFPDHRMRGSIRVRRSHFAGQVTWEGDDDATVTFPERPEAPPDGDGGDTAAAAVQAWSTRWQDHAAALQSIVDGRPRPWVSLVEDGMHRQLLWRALEGATNRLAISSSEAGPQVVNTPLIQALARRLEAGATVALRYGRMLGQDSAAGELRRLSDRFPGRMRLDEERTGIRALVADQEVVVGGFEFLAAEGYASGGGRTRSELSVQLGSRQVADRIAAHLGLGRPPARPARSSAPVVISSAGAALAQRLLNDLSGARPDGGGRAELVRQRLVGVDGLPDLLARLEADGAPAWLIRIVAAHHVRGHDERERERWLRWLLSDRWAEGGFVEAALLRGAVADPDAHPRPPLAVVAAHRRTAACARQMEPALIMDDLEPAEQAALVSVAAAELLLGPEEPEILADARPFLDALEPGGVCSDAGKPWTHLMDVVTGFWKAGQGRPLPLSGIREALDRSSSEDRLDGRWDALRRAIERAGQANLRSYVPARKMRRYLFHQQGIFGRLGQATEQRDLEAVREWLTHEGIADLGELVDDATRTASARGHLLALDVRQGYLRQLNEVVQAARAVASAAGDVAGDRIGWATRADRDLGSELEASWPELERAAAAMAEPERHLAVRALADLGEVVRWGGR